jgi:hypothetical protein
MAPLDGGWLPVPSRIVSKQIAYLRRQEWDDLPLTWKSPKS